MSFATKKALTSAAYHIDQGQAQRFAFERYNLSDADHCVDPNQLTFDQFHRLASPYSLTRVGQGGSCSALDPHLNLQAWLTRENNLDRPWIYADIAGGYTYDTLGRGRDIQQTYNGGTENNQGGWHRINMPKNHVGECQLQPPSHYHTDSAHGNRSMGPLAVYRYSG